MASLFPLEDYTNEMYAAAECRDAREVLAELRQQIEVLKEILTAAPDALTMGLRLDTTGETPRYFWPGDRCANCDAELQRYANWYRSL
jgi:hypothetical protein